jgi:hypothetical protein
MARVGSGKTVQKKESGCRLVAAPEAAFQEREFAWRVEFEGREGLHPDDRRQRLGVWRAPSSRADGRMLRSTSPLSSLLRDWR